MLNAAQETLGATTRAADGAFAEILGYGVVGALLVLSILANVALVAALIRCYKRHTNYLGGSRE